LRKKEKWCISFELIKKKGLKWKKRNRYKIRFPYCVMKKETPKFNPFCPPEGTEGIMVFSQKKISNNNASKYM